MIAAALVTPKPSGEDIFSGTMGTLRTGTMGEFSSSLQPRRRRVGFSCTDRARPHGAAPLSATEKEVFCDDLYYSKSLFP